SKLTLASNKQLPPYLAYLAAARTKIRSDVSRFALTPAVAGLAMSLRGGALSPRFSGKTAGSRKGHDFVEVASDDDFEGIDLEALLQSVTADIEEISVDPQELAHLGDFSGLGPLDFVRDGEADVDCVFQSKSEVGEDSRRGGIRPEQGVRRTEDKQEDQEHGPSDSCIESFGRDKEDRGVIPTEDSPRVCEGSGTDDGIDDAGVEEKGEGFSAGGMDGSAQNYACPTHGEEEKEVDVSFSSRVAEDEERGIRGDGFEVFCEAREGGVKGKEEDDEDDGGNEALMVEKSAHREEQDEKGQSNGLSKKIIKEKEEDAAGAGEEMLEEGSGEGEDNEEELVVNARHYEDKVVGDHDGEEIEDDGEEEEEYDEEQEEEEDDEEKEEEGKEQEDDEAGEMEEMLEEGGGEGEDNEEELVVNSRHYEDKVVGDHDEEGIEDDGEEEEGYDEEQEEGEDDEEEQEGRKSDDEEEEEYDEDDEEGEAWLEKWDDDDDDNEHVRFEVENDADGQEDWDGREPSQVDEQKENDDGGGEEIMDEFEEGEEESEWETDNDEKSDESEIVDEWKNAAGMKEPRKIEQPQGMEGEDVVEDYDEGEETESQGGGVRDDWDGEEDEDEWDDEEKNDDDWDYEDTAGEEDEPVASGAKEEEEEEEMVEAAEEEEKDVGVEAEDQDGPKLKMGNKEIGRRVESTSSGESSSEWVTDGEDSEGDDSLGEGSEGDDSLGESSEGDDSLGEEALVDDVSFDEAESEEEDTPGTESEGPTTPTSSHSYVKTHSLSSEREASSDGARHRDHSDGVPLPRQDIRENRDLPGGRARNALPEGITAGVSSRRQKGKLPRSGTTVVSDSREENRAEPPTVVGASLATDEGDGDEAMVEEKVLGMEEWIDTQRRDPVPSKAPPRKTLDQVLEEGLGEIDDEDSARDIARQLREHRELGRRWVTGITTSTGLGRTRKQTMKVLLLQATANIIAGGAPERPGRERLTLAGLAVGGGTIAVHKLLRRRIEAADFGKAADVEAETLSPLGMLLRKKASMGRISAKEHDLACLRSAARWGIILFAAGAVFSLVLGVENLFRLRCLGPLKVL
ncbi:unnamed protein product, partial [Ascophyllum nodosum]